MKKNLQENFWSGKFGSNYISRNSEQILNSANYHFFKKILKKINFKSFIEFGSNVGVNITSIKKINPKIKKISAIEINRDASDILKKKHKDITVHNTSIANFSPIDKFDLVLCKGILIHVNPDQLNVVYDKIYKSCDQYILIAEYYSPTPTKIIYRKHKDKLFKRDFAGELLKKYKKLKLIDYGFVYHRDKYPQDDINWFLLKKNL
jgi:spore coat polysaccharide biosynthesis protein SpsF